MTLTGTPAARAAAAKRAASSSSLERADRDARRRQDRRASRRVDAARPRRRADRRRAPASRPTGSSAKTSTSRAGGRQQLRLPGRGRRAARHARRACPRARRTPAAAPARSMRGGCASAGMRGAFMLRLPLRALGRSCAIILFSSGRQEPQLVPARSRLADLGDGAGRAGGDGIADAALADAEAGADHRLGLDHATSAEIRASEMPPSSCDVERAELAAFSGSPAGPMQMQPSTLAVDDGGGAIACAGRDARRASRRR